jgi:hypothetical protein
MHGDTAAASDKMRNIRTRDRTSDPDSPYCSQFLFPPSVVSIHAVSITAHRARGAASRAYRAGSERAERSAGVSETWRRRSALGGTPRQRGAWGFRSNQRAARWAVSGSASNAATATGGHRHVGTGSSPRYRHRPVLRLRRCRGLPTGGRRGRMAPG